MKKIIIALLCGILLTNCSFEYPISDLRQGSIPSDLKKNGHILLVLGYDEVNWTTRGENKKVREIMNKRYNGEFELVTKKELENNKKYADTDKYRYLLRRNMGGGSVVSNYNSSNHTTTSAFYTDQTFVDRKTEQEYPSTRVMTPSYHLAVTNLLKVMNKM